MNSLSHGMIHIFLFQEYHNTVHQASPVMEQPLSLAMDSRHPLAMDNPLHLAMDSPHRQGMDSHSNISKPLMDSPDMDNQVRLSIQ